MILLVLSGGGFDISQWPTVNENEMPKVKSELTEDENGMAFFTAKEDRQLNGVRDKSDQEDGNSHLDL